MESARPVPLLQLPAWPGLGDRGCLSHAPLSHLASPPKAYIFLKVYFHPYFF